MALDTSGAILAVDTVASIDKRDLAEFTVGSTSGSATFLQPFGSRSLYAFGPRGEHAVAASGTYSIRWFDRRGRRIRTIVGDGSPPPLSQRERDNAARTIASIAERNRLTPSRLPFGIPDRKPVLMTLGYDLDGRLWVRRSTADGASQEADVYGSDGKLMARVSWPNNVRLNVFASSGMVAWGVETRADETVGVVSLRFGVVP